MSDLEIVSERVKTIRKARKIGRSKLAKLTGLTERQLTKIETAGTAPLPEVTVGRLAAALGVPTPTLTGHLQMIDDDLQQEQKSSCTSGCCG